MDFVVFSPLFVQPNQPANTSLTALHLDTVLCSININVRSCLWRPSICKSKIYQLFSTNSWEEYLAFKLSDVLLCSHTVQGRCRAALKQHFIKKRLNMKPKQLQQTILIQAENLWLISFSHNSSVEQRKERSLWHQSDFLSAQLREFLQKPCLNVPLKAP